LDDAMADDRRLPRTLRETRLLAFTMLCMGLIGVGVGIALREWGFVAFSILLVFFGVWQLARPGTLTISESSIVVRHFGRTETFVLADCGEFITKEQRPFPGGEVIFDYRLADANWLQRRNRRMLGRSHGLPATYGLRATDLATMLNDARTTASDNASGVDTE
jgi:hypothetical protein